jgi:hypothetical protein
VKRVLFTAALFLTCFSLSWAQTSFPGKISGNVKDASGKPMEFVSILLLKAKDSTLVLGGVTNVSGIFELENVREGSYLIATSQIGYQKTFSEALTVDAAHPWLKISTLQLKEETTQLNAVTVTARKPFIEQQVDRLVLNVENSIVSSGNSALEVLEKAPGVTVDRQNESIQLKGKQGVTIMVDGKQTYLSGQELTNLLKNTPSDNIEKIEIITNPSSKYDAAGNSGIINIKMKKNKNYGMNGGITLGTGIGRYEKSNGSLRLNQRQGKMNAFGNYSFWQNHSFQENDLNRVLPKDGTTNYFDQQSKRPNMFIGHNYRAGIDYFLNKKSTLGLLVTGFYNDRRQANAETFTDIKDASGQLVRQTNTQLTDRNNRINFTGNLNYKYEFDDKGREWTVDADYSRFSGSSYTQMTTSYLYDRDKPLAPTEIIQNYMPPVVNIWAFKSDYVHPLKNGGKWEAGIKSSFVNTDNNLVYENWGDNRWIFDNQYSNHFQYTENINAGYMNFSGKLNKKTQIQLGLRAEQTRSEGHQVFPNDSLVKRNYLNVFPTFFLSHQLDSSNTLNLSYSRRIDRPNYQDLNPFRFYLDKYTYQIGNPYLRPQFTHSIQLAHTYKGAFSTTLAYSRTSDVIVREAPGQNVAKNETFVMGQNLDNMDNVSLTISTPIPVSKWWNIHTNFSLYYNHYKAPYLGGVYNIEVVAYNAYMGNNFTLGKGFSAELAGWYNSAGLYGFFKSQPMGAFSLGVQKAILNKKGNIKLNINDPLWLNRFRGSTNYEGINFKIQSRWESRVARLTFTYNFGNQNVKAARQRSTSTEAERNRVGGGNN